MRVPIACTLTSESAAARLEEWRHFFADSTGAVEQLSDMHVRVRLTNSTQAVQAAVDLAQREKACCAFFEFSIEVEADASWLSVKVPPDAVDTLAGFVSMLPRRL
jgi:arsenate reductase